MALGDIQPISSRTGSHSVIQPFLIGASQTFKIGEPVKDASGLIVVSTDGIGLEAGGILIAAEPAATTTYPAGVAVTTSRATGTNINCYVLQPGDLVLCANYSTDGAGTAAGINPRTGLNAAVGFVVDGSGNWYCDTSATKKVGVIQQVVAKSTTSASAFQRKRVTDSTTYAAGTFSVIVRIGRDFV